MRGEMLNHMRTTVNLTEVSFKSKIESDSFITTDMEVLRYEINPQDQSVFITYMDKFDKE